MPLFDLKSWKEVCPEHAAKNPLNAFIKEWNAHCPDKDAYDDPATDPRKLVNVATSMCKKLELVVKATEKMLGRPSGTDRKLDEKIHDAHDLMASWEKKAQAYVAEVTKWSQTTLKEETEERKNLWRAQEHFIDALVDGFEGAMNKLAAPARDFEAAFKARNLVAASAKFNLHRKLLAEASYHLRPISIAKVREATAAKFHVPLNQLAVPGKFHALAAKVKKADERDDDMQDRLDTALENEANGVSEPDESTTPAYRKEVRELLLAFRGVVVKMKWKAAEAAQDLQAANQIKAVPVTDPAFHKKVLECRALNEKAFASKKEIHGLLDQMRNPNSPWRKKAAAAGLTEADDKRTLLPQVNAALAFTRRIVGIDNQATRALEEWLHAVDKAHPESKEAKAELSNMSGKYHVRLI